MYVRGWFWSALKSSNAHCQRCAKHLRAGVDCCKSRPQGFDGMCHRAGLYQYLYIVIYIYNMVLYLTTYYLYMCIYIYIHISKHVCGHILKGSKGSNLNTLPMYQGEYALGYRDGTCTTWQLSSVSTASQYIKKPVFGSIFGDSQGIPKVMSFLLAASMAQSTGVPPWYQTLLGRTGRQVSS